MDLNLVVLTGNVGQEPTIHRGESHGKDWAITRFSMATNRKFKKGDDWKTEVTWHVIVLFGYGLGNLAEKYIHKGTRLAIQGRLSVNEWTRDDGSKRSQVEIHVDQFGGQVNLEGGRQKEGRTSTPATDSAYGKGGEPHEFDDDIPF